MGAGEGTEVRVLFIGHTGALGGAELCLLDIASHFRPPPAVMLFEDGPLVRKLRDRGVKVVGPSEAALRVSRKGGIWQSIRAIPGVLRLADATARNARGYDVIFANSQKALVVSAVAAILARKPLVWFLHDILSAQHFGRANRWLVVLLSRFVVSQVIANSDATRSAFYHAGGNGVPVALVYNGIDPELYQRPADARLIALRQELRIESRPIVGVFSRLAPWKGQHVLIEALAQLPGVHALVVGDALFAGEKNYGEMLQSQACELGIPDRVHFLGFRDDIPSLMHLCDVVVHSSVAPEPFGRVIVEGMLSRKPVIATRGGGTGEIIEDGVTGRLVTPENAEELADVLRSLFAEPVKAEALASAGYVSAAKRFSTQSMIDGIQRQIAIAVGRE